MNSTNNVSSVNIQTTAGIVGLVMLIIVFGVLIIVAFELSERTPPTTQVTEQYTTNNSELIGNYGGVSNMHDHVSQTPGHSDASGLERYFCNSNHNASWRNGVCSCFVGMYGNTCNMEKFDNAFTNMGQVSINNVDSEKTQVEASSKSFADDSCSEQCKVDDNCLGFWYSSSPPLQSPTCHLLYDEVNVTGINYNLEEEGNLYLKNPRDLNHQDKVILSIDGVLRPWLQSSGYTQVSDIGVPSTINLKHVKNIRYNGPKNVVGMFSNFPISKVPINVRRLLGAYLHIPSLKDIEIPEDLKAETIHFMYVYNDD